MIVHSRTHTPTTALLASAMLVLMACATPEPEPAEPFATVEITGETQCRDVQSYAAGIRRVIGPAGSRGKIELKCGDVPIEGAGCVATVGVAGDACSVPEVEVPGSDQAFRCDVAPVDPPPYPTRILVSGCAMAL